MVSEDGVQGSTCSKLKNKRKPPARNVQHSIQLDEMVVIKAEAEFRFAENLRSKSCI